MISQKKAYKKVTSNIKNPYKMIENLKYSESLLLKKEFVKKMNSGIFPGKSIYNGKILCNEIRDLLGTQYIIFKPKTPLTIDLEWLYLKLSQHTNEIKKYLELKSIYEKCLMLGSYNEALEVIKSINRITKSFWAMEQEFLCLELRDGYESNSIKLSEYTAEFNNTLNIVLAQFSSDRASVLNNHISFEHKVNNYINTLDDTFSSIVIKDYMTFFYKEEYENLDMDSAKRLLSFIDMFSLIDMYEMSNKVVSVLSINEIITLNELKVIWKELSFENIDTIQMNTENLFNKDEKKICPLKINEIESTAEIIELYTTNQFKECESLIEVHIMSYGLDFSILDVFVKCTIYTNSDIKCIDFIKNKEVINILVALKNIYISNETERNLNEIRNKSKILYGINFNLNTDLVIATYKVKQEKMNVLWNMTTIYSKVLTPLKFKNDYLMLEKLNKFGFNESTNLFTKGNLKELDFRGVFYEAINNKNTNIEAAVEILETRKDSYTDFNIPSNIYEYERVLKELFYMYMEKKSYETALSLVVKSYFINPNFIIRLDLEALLKVISDTLYSSNVDKIYLGVLFYLVYPKNTYELYRALVLLLREYKLILPSEFFVSEKFDLKTLGSKKHELCFVLDKLYKFDVMKHFVYINPKNRTSERIIILLNLLNNNYGKKSNIFDELELIIKEDSIKNRVIQIDQKKIFVDTDSIFEKYEDVYLDRFKHFLMLDKLDVGITRYDTSNILNYFDLNERLSKEFEKAPEKKIRFVLFKEMVLDYIKDLTLNKNYGLEKFLSSRIRHGTLEDTLTNVLSKNNLLSSREETLEGAKYKNSFRIEQLHALNDRLTVKKVLDSLNIFTIEIIELVEKVTEWFKVKTSVQKNGIFDYSYFENDRKLKIHYTNFNDIKNFNGFYSRITDLFWGQTEEILKILKEKLQNQVSNYIYEKLDKLESKISSLNIEDKETKKVMGHICRDITNAKAKFRNDILEISKWLVVQRNNEFHDFNLGELVDTSIEINNKAHTSVRHKHDIFVENITIKGKYFGYFVDILTMIYSNAVKHCEYANHADLELHTEIESVDYDGFNRKVSNIKALRKYDVESAKSTFKSEKVIWLSVTNNLHSSVDQLEIADKIQEKINLTEQDEIPEEIILGEGGTGILKIHALLTYNIGTGGNTFYYVEDDQFHVNYLINLEGVSVDEHTSN